MLLAAARDVGWLRKANGWFVNADHPRTLARSALQHYARVRFATGDRVGILVTSANDTWWGPTPPRAG